MLFFNCDYTEGAHPLIMERMLQTNMEQTVGYGEDEHCERARTLIKKKCGDSVQEVHFLVGGTQANFTVIRTALRPHQGVISPDAGHIHVHETGAVEATGHKVLAVPCGPEGKISAAQVEAVCKEHYAETTPYGHTVQPKMVYISHPTETGALYFKEELAALRRICDEFGLFLFCDGARMGYGLTAKGADVTLPDLTRFCDVFTIGGTKCGALFGEAVVVTNPEINRDFRYAIKQNGGMLAKGRLLGIQFETLFEDGLYEEICGRANQLAYQLADAFSAAGYKEYAPSPTNQQFFVLPNVLFKELSRKYSFSFWGKVDETHSAIRVCTSWATTDQAVQQLMEDVKNYKA